MRWLIRIAHVNWQDKIPNTEVLETCHITGIKAFLLSAQFHWTGHVIRMEDNRLLKQVFYSQLEQGTCSHRRPDGFRDFWQCWVVTDWTDCDGLAVCHSHVTSLASWVLWADGTTRRQRPLWVIERNVDTKCCTERSLFCTLNIYIENKRKEKYFVVTNTVIQMYFQLVEKWSASNAGIA